MFKSSLNFVLEEMELFSDLTKNLEVLSQEFLAKSESERPSEQAVKDAFNHIHSENLRYSLFVSKILYSFSSDIDLILETENIYFSQYVNSKIDAKYRGQLKQNFLWPVVLAVCNQYKPPSLQRGLKSKKAKNLGYEKYFQEFLPVIGSPTSLGQKEIDDKRDYQEFRRLFRHYSSTIEEMIHYSPQDEDEYDEGKHLKIEYVRDFIIIPFLSVLPIEEKPHSGSANARKLTEQDVAKTLERFFKMFLCVFNIVVTKTEVDYKTFSEQNESKVKTYVCEDHKTVVIDLKSIVQGDYYLRDVLRPRLKLYPDGKVLMDLLIQNRIFDMDKSYYEFRNFTNQSVFFEGVAQICTNVFPIEIKKEITNRGKSLTEEDLTTNSDNLTTIQYILQQVLCYTFSSEEIMCHKSLMAFTINNEIHIGLVSIDLDSLTFEDGPNNTKIVRLKTIKKKGKTFKLIPVKIDELGSLSDFNSSNTPMVKLFVQMSYIFHKFWKNTSVMVDTHMKVLAIRDELRKKNRKSERKSEENAEERRVDKKRSADQSDKSNKRTQSQSQGQNRNRNRNRNQGQTRYGTESKVQRDSTSAVDISRGNASTNPSSSGSDESIKMRDIEYLKISFSNNNEGHLDYVTNLVSNPKYPKLKTVRGINLHHRFGIQLDSQHIVGAQNLFMSKDCFLKGKKAALERFGSISDAEDVEVLNTASSNLTNDLVFKYYTPFNIVRSLQFRDWIDPITTTSIHKYETTIIQPMHRNELKALDTIHKFNETQKDPSKTIYIPKVLMRVNQLDMYLGPHTCQEMDYIIITERLIEEQEWANILPLEANVINNACEQIDLMIRHAGIRHNDLERDNLIYYNQHIYFIDFDQSEDYKTMDKEIIESAIKEDQKLLRYLLETPI